MDDNKKSWNGKAERDQERVLVEIISIKHFQLYLIIKKKKKDGNIEQLQRNISVPLKYVKVKILWTKLFQIFPHPNCLKVKK